MNKAISRATSARSSHPVGTNCREMAYQLHREYQGKFPSFWKLIDNDRDKLAAIFEFFCAMRKLLLATPDGLIQLLHKRLAARRTQTPAPLPQGFESLIASLSHGQLTEFSKLAVLTKPAFELFVTAALTAKDQTPPVARLTADDPIELPEPDSAAFFYWSEFAFLAIDAGYDPDKWKEILCILIRAQRIYALCYGKPVKGKIPESTKFSTYLPQNFSPILPEVAHCIRYPANDLKELKASANDCVLFAFPGGVD